MSKPFLISSWRVAANFALLTTIALLAMKLSDPPSVTWLWVFSPLWLIVAMWVLVNIFVGVLMLFAKDADTEEKIKSKGADDIFYGRRVRGFRDDQ